jgi:glycosyltransferase involved in cell wall biosynthesis
MKILRIIARLNVGGPARHVVWLTERLQDDEFQSTLIAGTVPPGEEDMGYFAAEHDVTPIYINELSRELSLKDLVSLWRVYRRILKFRPDIVHTHTAKAGTIGRIAAFCYKWSMWRPLKVVHTFHGHVFHSYYGRTRTRIFVTIEKLLARFATDRIITISNQQYNEIHKRFGVGRKEQFRVVPLGIDLTQFDNEIASRQLLRNAIGASEAEIVVGFVGRLTAIKDVAMLIAAADLVKQDPASPPLRFVIIGDGELRGELETMVGSLDLGDSVKFLGNRTDIAALLPGLDIISLTSANEGTPLSLIEAMACGIPFVSTAVGGVVDLAGDKIESCEGYDVCERGLVTVPGSPRMFAAGLIYLAKNEKLRKRLAMAGNQFVVSRYSTDRLVNDLKEIYRELAPKS